MIIKLILFFILNILVYSLLLFSLKQIKLYQNIYKLSPPSHQTKKQTPSFGGLGLLLTLSLSLFLFGFYTKELLWLLTLILSFGGIGFLDDFLSNLHHKNKGLSAPQKFLTQVILGSFLLFIYSFFIAPLSPFSFLFAKATSCSAFKRATLPISRKYI